MNNKLKKKNLKKKIKHENKSSKPNNNCDYKYKFNYKK